MKYNYKKGSSRPSSCTTTRIQLFKGLLSIQLLSSLRSNKIVVNIDEWSFERSVKQNYSWLAIDHNWSILHEPIEEKWSLILASFSNGEWFVFLKKGTVNSKFFLLFLEIVESLILSNWDNPTEKYLLLLDNASIHASKLLKNNTRIFSVGGEILDSLYSRTCSSRACVSSSKGKAKEADSWNQNRLLKSKIYESHNRYHRTSKSKYLDAMMGVSNKAIKIVNLRCLWSNQSKQL